MFYSIQHTTTFTYNEPITENIMELRKQPLDDSYQRCLRFQLALSPKAQIYSYRDYLGNTVHHFDIPAAHSKLVIGMEAVVELRPSPVLPAALTPEAWAAFNDLSGEHYDMLQPSHFTEPTALVQAFANEIGLTQRDDPLTLLRWLNTAIYNAIDYVPNSTSVESVVDDVLKVRAGVCQDYAHLMIALVRGLGIPCRYVSGYLYHRQEHDRSVVDATHAWVEAWLPTLGWVGFDPTNNVICAERHIRVAVGRDYADVPPTRGVFKGDAQSELSVAVQVREIDEIPAHYQALVLEADWPEEPITAASSQAAMQQMQQQQ